MGIRYREDPHLEFLQTLNNDELDVLVEILTDDVNSDLATQKEFKKHYPNHKKYWKLIAADYQLFGGNSFSNLWRGHGAPYKRILRDVCDIYNIKYRGVPVEELEQKLLLKTLTKSIDKMDLDMRKNLVKHLDMKTTDFSKRAIRAALQIAIKQGGFFPYKMSVIIANAISKKMIGRGLSLGMNSALTKSIANFAGPIGWIITGLWTVIDISGPAYRVTGPATVYIASLRQIKLNKGY